MNAGGQRPITDTEAAVVRWLLANAPSHPLSPGIAATVDALKVVGRCDCGCASIDFQKGGQAPPFHPIADAIGNSESGLRVGVILWGNDSAVSGLEVYERDPGSSQELPVLESLEPWDSAAD